MQARAGDERIVVLEGELVRESLPAVLDALDGERTVEDIVQALDGSIDRDTIIETVETLTEKGLLEDGAEWPDDLSAAERDGLVYFTNFGLAPKDVRATLAGTDATVVGDGPLAAELTRSLTNHGVRTPTVVPEEMEAIHASLERADIAIWAEGRASNFGETCLNPLCLELEKSWLYVSAAPGHHGVVGPLFVPPHTCCFACYRERIRSNTAAPEELRAYEEHLADGTRARGFGSLSGFHAILANLATMELLKHLLSFRACSVYSRSITVDFVEPKVWSEPVWKWPECRACGRCEGSPR